MAQRNLGQWLIDYGREVQRQLKGCKKRPKWQHLPAGHRYFADGLSAKKAATKYLDSASAFGRQKCRRK